MTSQALELIVSEGENPRVIFDTESIITAYNRKGSAYFSMLDPDNAEYYLPAQVLSELDKQYHAKKVENGRIMVPWDLLGAVYRAIEEKRVTVLYPEIGEIDRQKMRGELLKGSGNKRNSRLGEGDMAVVKAAMPMERAIVVSNDSDISFLVEGGDYNNIRVIPTEEYLRTGSTLREN